MESIMSGAYVNNTLDDYDYPSVAHIKKTGVMPKPRPTAASLAVEQARLKAQEQVRQLSSSNLSLTNYL